MAQEAFENVVSRIKDVHASLDDEGRKVLVALLEQANLGGDGSDIGEVHQIKFAPDRTVMLRVGEGSACW